MQDVSSSGLIATTSSSSISFPSNISADGRFFRLHVVGSQNGGTHTYMKLPNSDGIFDITNIGDYCVDLLCFWKDDADENMSWSGFVISRNPGNGVITTYALNQGGSGLNGDVPTQADIEFIITQDSGSPTVRQMALSFA